MMPIMLKLLVLSFFTLQSLYSFHWNPFRTAEARVAEQARRELAREEGLRKSRALTDDVVGIMRNKQENVLDKDVKLTDIANISEGLRDGAEKLLEKKDGLEKDMHKEGRGDRCAFISAALAFVCCGCCCR